MQTKLDISLADLDLPFTPSPIMDYHEIEIVEMGNRIIVGYIADDHDCENPLESCDGMGEIYTAHRHSGNHAEMQKALGLGSDWEKDLDLLDEHLGELRPAWIDAATQSDEFQAWVKTSAGSRTYLSEAYYRQRAEKLWEDTGGEHQVSRHSIHSFVFTEGVRESVWKTLRDNGKIGDQDAVVLDCYEHGQQVWSIAGTGYQCRFDTARGAGVWVPNDSAREEINRRSEVYAFGRVVEYLSKQNGSAEVRFIVKMDGPYRGLTSPAFHTWFHTWHEAFAWLKEKSSGMELASLESVREVQVRLARQRATREMVVGILEDYNQWLGGECYGIVAAEYHNVGSKDDPEWKFVESDDCWGFIGSDYAMEEARANARAIAKHKSLEAA